MDSSSVRYGTQKRVTTPLLREKMITRQAQNGLFYTRQEFESWYGRARGAWEWKNSRRESMRPDSKCEVQQSVRGSTAGAQERGADWIPRVDTIFLEGYGSITYFERDDYFVAKCVNTRHQADLPCEIRCCRKTSRRPLGLMMAWLLRGDSDECGTRHAHVHGPMGVPFNPDHAEQARGRFVLECLPGAHAFLLHEHSCLGTQESIGYP